MAGTLSTRGVGYRGLSAAFSSFEIARELDHSLCAAKNPAPFVGSGLPKTHAERAPMAAADVNRRGEVLHQDEIAASHFPPVCLQQERLGVVRHLANRAIVEQPLVSQFALFQTGSGP